MGIKLMLDTEAILKVLETAGPEAAVELRSSIVQEFAKKHLKGVISDKALEKARQDCMAEIHNHITAFYADITKGSYGSKDTYKLKPEIASDIKKRVEVFMVNSVADLVKEAIAATDLASLVDFAIKKYVNQTIDNEVSRRVKEKVAALNKVLVEE